MRARLGYFSFILAFFLCTSLMFVFLAQARADAGPDSRAFLVEKRYYAISDMEYAMYQGAGPALEEAKDNVTAAKEILDAAAIEFPFLEPVAQGAKMEDAEIAKRLVLYRLIQDSGEISSNYPDYDVKFWCGPLNQPIKQAVLESMLATGSEQ
ncbi:MAG TPA: hypothetical protein PLO51_02945 [Candidatus Micrarchaeota archaeon]|nr:hypothetical protein [Candidatus Micrarchaeota archaeon]